MSFRVSLKVLPRRCSRNLEAGLASALDDWIINTDSSANDNSSGDESESYFDGVVGADDELEIAARYPYRS